MNHELKDHAQLIRNRKAKCDSCGGRTKAVNRNYDRWLVYFHDALVCIPCAAILGGMTQEQLVQKLLPTADHFPNRIPNSELLAERGSFQSFKAGAKRK